MNQEEAIQQVNFELTIARKKFEHFASPHEGLAIIQEEFEELKSEVFKQRDVRSHVLLRKEAKQLAAMAVRFMADLT